LNNGKNLYVAPNRVQLFYVPIRERELFLIGNISAPFDVWWRLACASTPHRIDGLQGGAALCNARPSRGVHAELIGDQAFGERWCCGSQPNREAG